LNVAKTNACEKVKSEKSEQTAEKIQRSVILSEAKNLSSIVSMGKSKKERFFASLRMTT